ncbi:MAG: heme-binding protein [Thermoguttaceae bacterium]|jgi:hypothetical protein|nr:heme-binding protein [Thermoguttaceae bacterium]
MRWLATLTSFLAGLAVLAAAEPPTRFDHPGDGLRLSAADRLREGLEMSRALGIPTDAKQKTLLEAIHEAVTILGSDSLVSKRLGAVADSMASVSPDRWERDTQTLRFEVAEWARDLSFRPRKEAALPSGFPPPTPVGEIEIKTYPGYRKAETQGNSNLAFWTLFTHIKRNGIAMTAPVEMGSFSDAVGTTLAGTMAFLYRDGSLGKPGAQGPVVVADVPAMTVVSTGVRGPQTRDSVRLATQRLQAWLERNRASWTATGSVRVMGYNSPFVPLDENYFEVQIPVQSAGDHGQSLPPD